MLLNRGAIEGYLASGEIVVSPFKAENLGTAQYDVALGAHIYREVQTMPIGLVCGRPVRPIFNPFDEEQVRRKWQLDSGVLHCDFAADRTGELFRGINSDEKIIVVNPGEMILAHTEEFIGGRSRVTTMMRARSSMGRNNIEVCAGMGDVGYFNRWTMEITNNNPNRPIILVVGRRIAQMLFFDVGEVSDAHYEVDGEYQGTADVEALRASWTPEAMLPKQWLDRECRR